MTEFKWNMRAGNERFLKLDEFTRGYIEGALFASGEEIGNVSLDDLAEVTWKEAFQQCKTFQIVNAAVLAEAYLSPAYNERTAGHDLWLTRNGHGAGYWDRGLNGAGDDLTLAAELLGTCELYRGDDDKLYFGG